MGYYIFSYGINANQVRQVFGSGDAALIGRVEQNETFRGYAEDDWDDYDIDLEQALQDIVRGNALQDRANHIYGYALIGICATLGKELPHTQEIKLGYETDFINMALADDFGFKDFSIEDVLFREHSADFPMPAISDWPLIGLLKYEELLQLKERLAAAVITEEQIDKLTASEEEEEEEKGYAYEHIRGIQENIDYCISHKLDLISFCH